MRQTEKALKKIKANSLCMLRSDTVNEEQLVPPTEERIPLPTADEAESDGDVLKLRVSQDGEVAVLRQLPLPLPRALLEPSPRAVAVVGASQRVQVAHEQQGTVAGLSHDVPQLRPPLGDVHVVQMRHRHTERPKAGSPVPPPCCHTACTPRC